MRRKEMFRAVSVLGCSVIILSVVLSGFETCYAATASLQNIERQAAEGYTRVVIGLDSEVRFESARLTDPDRIFFDISNSKLGDDFQLGNLAAKDQVLNRIRVAQNRPDVVRVVLNVSREADYRIAQLRDPFRIVVDVFSPSGAKTNLNPSPVQSSPRPDVARRTASVGSVTVTIASLSIPGIAESTVPAASGAEPVPSRSSLAASASLPSADESEPPAASSTSDVVVMEPGAEQQMAIIVNPPKGNLKKITESERSPLPLNVSGTLSSGYYSSFTRGGGNGEQRISFVPTGAVFDINGYYLSPDTLDYTVRSELHAGAQASDAGFEGGNGVRMNLSAFRRGVFPTSFRYSNLQLKDAYFGSLTQVSSYTLQNRNKDVGFTAGLRQAGLPTATLDWGTSSVRSKAYTPAIPDYVSQSSHLNLNCSDQRWGWDFQCFAGRQKLTSDLFTPADEAGSGLLRQRVTEYRGSARRGFWTDSDLYVDGGNQYTSNYLLNRPIDLTTRYASVNLRMFQKRRWKASMRAGYSSNIAGLVLTQLVGGLGGNGSVAPGATILQPFQRTTSYLNLNGLTSVDLSRGFSLYGSLDRTAVLTASEGGLSSRYLTTGGGVTFSRSFRWGSLSGQYGRSFGLGSITGQTGRIAGHNYVVAAQPGKADGLLFDLSIRGSSQSVRNDMPARERSFSSDIGMGFPIWDRLRVRVGGGWQKGSFTNQGNEFRTSGYAARAGLEHPRFQLNGTLNSNVGNSLQAFSPVVNGMGVGSTFLTPLRLVPSDLRGITLTVRIVPMRKLELSALFTRSVQHLEGLVANDFEVIDVYATYHFRRLQVVAGYFSSIQTYSSLLATYPETERGRFYVRIVRPVKFL